MKKALISYFIWILWVFMFSNISYATSSWLFDQIFDGKSEVKISTYQTTSVAKPASLSKESIAVIDKSFKNIKEKLLKYSVSSRIDVYQKASEKIDKLIVLRKTKSEKDALRYLNDLVKNEINKLADDQDALEELFWLDESICATDYVYKNGDCVKKESYSDSIYNDSNRKICSVSNWYGYQYYENNRWSYCRISQCNEWYTIINNSCVRYSWSYYYNNWYYNNYQTQYCSISNGYGKQYWNGSSWSSCSVESCNNWYYISGNSCVRNYNYNNCAWDEHLENGYCVSDKRYCSISNGYGKQIWYGTSWGTCTPESCNSWYYISGNSCLRDYYYNDYYYNNCYGDEHYENGSCVSNSKYCSLSNWYGVQYWNGSYWWSCNLQWCDSWYYISGNSCIRRY